MGLSCWRYRCYDWFKQRWLGSKLFYSGQRFQHFDTVTLIGTVCDCPHKSTDGDDDVDVIAESPDALKAMSERWHIESTPCDHPTVRETLMQLSNGQRVKITGVRTFDPDHHIAFKKFVGGKWEIHGISDVQILGS